MRPVLLPRARLTKSHVASRRQSIFANVPFLKLPPIEDQFRRVAASNRDIRRTFPLDNSQRQTPGCLANLLRTHKESAGGAAAKVGFRVDDDWPVRRLGNERKSLGRQIFCFRVGIDADVENGGVIRERGNPFFDCPDGKPCQIDEFEVTRSNWEFLAERVVVRVRIQAIANDRKSLEIWIQYSRGLDQV